MCLVITIVIWTKGLKSWDIMFLLLFFINSSVEPLSVPMFDLFVYTLVYVNHYETIFLNFLPCVFVSVATALLFSQYSYLFSSYPQQPDNRDWGEEFLYQLINIFLSYIWSKNIFFLQYDYSHMIFSESNISTGFLPKLFVRQQLLSAPCLIRALASGAQI